jgi:hypothetical protein
LKVSDDDDLPKRFCHTCVGLLETLENFKEACAQSVDTIRKLIVANLKEEPIEEIVSAEALEPIVKAENVENDNVKSPKDQRQRPTCHLCGKSYADMKSIRNHMNFELKKLKKFDLLTNPEVNSRLGNQSIQSLLGQLPCTQEGCHRYFKTQKSLDGHNSRCHRKVSVSSF